MITCAHDVKKTHVHVNGLHLLHLLSVDHSVIEITLMLHAHQSFVHGFQKELEGVQ